MGAAVRLRTDLSADELRVLAKRAEDADQARRLLSLAAVLDGMSRKARGRDWRDGSTDVAGLGAPVQREGSRRADQRQSSRPTPETVVRAETRVEADRGSGPRSR